GPNDFVGPVHLGNPDEFTILELAQLVIELTESKSQIVFAPLPEDDPTRRKPDIRLAREKLDWQPTLPLREGLGRTVEWFGRIELDSFRPPTPNY
ncbi:MAG: SDR family NAD-dependent epimerase/dehydratase, partial [Pirellulales bacterium]